MTDAHLEFDCEGCGVPVVYVVPSPAAETRMCAVCLWLCAHVAAEEIMEVRRRCEPGGWQSERVLRAYRDYSYPERPCDFCGKPYRGPAVYCSLACAETDA